MKVLFLIILAGLVWASVLIARATQVLPIKELRRRARGKNDSTSRAIYKVAAYGPSIYLLLWLTSSLAAAGWFLLAEPLSWWLVFGGVLVFGWLAWRGHATLRPSGWQWGLAGYLAPLASGLLSLLQPILGPIADWLDRRNIFSGHTNVYEKEDLLELLKRQNGQVDNRITEAELKIARGALIFGDKIVGHIMAPRKSVKMVVATDPIGPLLMDELHASGLSRFPVIKEPTKSTSPEIVGILYLNDVIGHASKGRVRDVMKKDIHFINEAQDLKEALAAFLHTEHQLLIVVNNFEEIVGIVTIEDVLEQILGEKLTDEFERYDDLQAVAGKEGKQSEVKHSEPEVVE